MGLKGLIGARRDLPARCGQPVLAPDAIRVARAWSSTLYFLGAAMLLIRPWDQSLHQTRGDSVWTNGTEAVPGKAAPDESGITFE